MAYVRCRYTSIAAPLLCARADRLRWFGTACLAFRPNVQVVLRLRRSQFSNSVRPGRRSRQHERMLDGGIDRQILAADDFPLSVSYHLAGAGNIGTGWKRSTHQQRDEVKRL